MKREKAFDCVKMKNDIQDALYSERKGMSQAEVRESIERNLAASQSPAAKMWRRLTKAHQASSRQPGAVLSQAH